MNEEKRTAIIRKYRSGMPLKELSKEMGIGSDTINRVMRESGLPMRKGRYESRPRDELGRVVECDCGNPLVGDDGHQYLDAGTKVCKRCYEMGVVRDRMVGLREESDTWGEPSRTYRLGHLARTGSCD